MRHLRSFTALVAAGIAAAPFSAMGQDFDVEPAAAAAKPVPTYNNEVRIGLGWQSQTSPLYGTYTGNRNQGPFAIGGFDFNHRDAWDSGGTTYYDANADNLGLESRWFNGQVGQQGTWGLNFSYEGVPYYQSRTFQSVYSNSAGNLANGVAPGSVRNATSQLSNKLNTFNNVGTQRDIFTLGGKYQWGDWTVNASIRHQHRYGYQENSLAWLGAPSPIAGNGNITSSALSYFLQPIDYDIDRYDITAVYGDSKRMQLLLGYTYNTFTDNNASWAGMNPFGFTSGAAATSGQAANLAASANINASYAQAPSNSAHQLKAQFGYNLTPTTRINANFQYGLMFQNDPFVASTGNANFAPIGPPRSSFDGTIQNVFTNVAITSKPLPRLDVTASYTLDDRNNLSSRAGYRQYINDAYSANPSTLYNLPLSYTDQKGKFEVGYRVLPGTRVWVSYSFDGIHRTYSNTNDLTTSEMAAGFRTALADTLALSVRYLHQDRWSGDYSQSTVFQQLGLPTTHDYYGYYNYYLASRTRNEIRENFDYMPTPGLTISIVSKLDYDYYPQSPLGLKSNNNISTGPDITYELSKSLSVHAYYTYQIIFFNTNSLISNATCNGAGTTLTPGPGCSNNGIWNQKTSDTTSTVGASVDWQPIPDKLKVSLDYTLSYGNTSYSFLDGGIYSFPTAGNVGTSTLFIQPLPDTRGVMNALTLRANYKIRDNVSLIGGVSFQRFNYKDYTYSLGATQFSNAVYPGNANPSYSVVVAGTALAIRF